MMVLCVHSSAGRSGADRWAFCQHEIGYSIPALLNKSKSKGSFFVNGANFRCKLGKERVSGTPADGRSSSGIYDHADEIKARYKAGHLIGSHTFVLCLRKLSNRAKPSSQVEPRERYQDHGGPA